MGNDDLNKLLFQVVDTISREEKLLKEVKQLNRDGLITDRRRDELLRHYETRLSSHIGYYKRLIKNLGEKNESI